MIRIKKCPKCGKEKPLKEFSRRKINYTESYCRTCKNLSSKLWLTNNKNKRKNYDLKRYYNINLEIFEVMWNDQKGMCFICGRKMNKKGKVGPRKYAVDHCHETNKVRGLLCSACNSRIVPHFEKHPERIDNLKIYLTRDVDYRELND